MRGQKLDGFKFSFQVPIDKYVADFCCRSHKLIGEVDGASHVGRESADRARDGVLVGLGYVGLRFSEQDIFEDMPVVLMKILDALERRPQFRY